MRERMRGDDAHPAIGAEPPGIAIAVAHSRGVARGAHELDAYTEAAAHCGAERMFQHGARHAHRDHALHVARRGVHDGTQHCGTTRMCTRVHACLACAAQQRPLDARIADVD